jgi:hypothetical protein
MAATDIDRSFLSQMSGSTLAHDIDGWFTISDDAE